MARKEFGYSGASVYYGKSGRPLGYQVEVWHDGLHEHRVLKDRDPDILRSKVESQLLKWGDKWKRAEAKRQETERRQRGKESADKATDDAQKAIDSANSILEWTLSVDDTVRWLDLQRHEPFVFQSNGDVTGIRFDKPDNRPMGTVQATHKQKPCLTDPEIRPRKLLLDKLVPFLGKKRDTEAEERLSDALAYWRSAEKEANQVEAERKSCLDSLILEYDASLKSYEKRCDDQDARVDDLRSRWLEGSPDAVEQHAELVLNASEYPDWIEPDFSVAFDDQGKIIVVDYELPPMDVVPTLTEVKYVAARDEYKEKHITNAQLKKLYDSVLYQIALRTLHELFEADKAANLKLIVLNGWVTRVNPGTGNKERKCILSVQSSGEQFASLDLAQVEPKACFKNLKGVAASSLSELAPVSPLLQFDSDDVRFVESREIADGLDVGSNLAAMGWEDFEHLVRELFSKHFEQGGGEVKVTRASRDGGVDAIAFDPDPIRGGKMVIQAKRYTNTVDVSAVRDLYGTVVNEGAVKGILITTSNYGPDSYEFAKDKPLSLLSGANLLHLMEQHGYKATINIEEAKRLAREA